MTFGRTAKTAAGLGLAGLMAAALSAGARAAEFDSIINRIKLPPGFHIGVFAKLPKPRSLAIGKPLGVIFVGSRHGTIHSIRDTNRDGIADEVLKRAAGLKVPNGVAIQDSLLYVAMQDHVAQWPVPAEFDMSLPVAPLVPIFKGLPDEFLHGWRYAKFGPDRKLYVAIGAPCNICMPKGLQGTIIRMDADGKNQEVFARGVRNSVGFDWNPITKVLYFTDNGGDGMGDDIPPDELNKADKPGLNFGYPFLGGKSVKLTGFEDKKAPDGVVGPVVEFQAHTANLGIKFYTGDMFPAEYKNDAFVAQHGSWNRTEPVGYRIMRIKFDDKGEVAGKEVFAEGWLKDGSAVGRPVDIAQLADGSLIVSDDFANVIYRIWYEK